MRSPSIIVITYFILSSEVIIHCLSASLGTAKYNCENGVYDTLMHVTEDCRVRSPSLRMLRKKQDHISGQDVADMFQNYCRVADDITFCVEETMKILKCVEGEQKTFEDLIRRSNWFCDGLDAKDVLKKIYEDLPMEELDYTQNRCYREAVKKNYSCVRKYLRMVSDPTDRRETMKKIISSFRCTFKRLSKRCQRGTAFLLTTLEYDWLIIPPAFGINVAATLISAAKG